MTVQRKFGGKKSKIILSSAVILVIIAAVAAYLINSTPKKESNTAGISIEDSGRIAANNSAGDSDSSSRVAATVEIMLEDCAVEVGTSFRVSAVVTPSDTDKALVWSSSDDSVLSVDASGNVSVNGVGTAVLTATVGNVSDAVVIEGVSDTAQGSTSGLPVYTADSVSWISGGYTGGSAAGSNGSTYEGYEGNGVSQGGFGGGSSTGNTGTSAGNTPAGGFEASDGNTGGQNQGNQGNSSQGGAVSGNNGNSSQNGGNSSDNGGSSSNNGGASDTGASGAQTSNTIGGSLPGFGFSAMMSNVYVYEDNGEYCGEVVTQPNVAIIYIMKRTAAFDNAIGQALEQLVPGGAQQIWNNYVSADSDRTFTIDDRTVRIVMPSSGGHSQIVIYN